MLLTTRDRACLPPDCSCFDVKRLSETSALRLLAAHAGDCGDLMVNEEDLNCAKDAASKIII